MKNLTPQEFNSYGVKIFKYMKQFQTLYFPQFVLMDSKDEIAIFVKISI